MKSPHRKMPSQHGKVLSDTISPSRPTPTPWYERRSDDTAAVDLAKRFLQGRGYVVSKTNEAEQSAYFRLHSAVCDLRATWFCGTDLDHKAISQACLELFQKATAIATKECEK